MDFVLSEIDHGCNLATCIEGLLALGQALGLTCHQHSLTWQVKKRELRKVKSLASPTGCLDTHTDPRTGGIEQASACDRWVDGWMGGLMNGLANGGIGPLYWL